jgi:hypothetical protein
MIRREAVLKAGVVRGDDCCWHVPLLQEHERVERFSYANNATPVTA